MAEPKFLYGSHYSTPGYVLYYLARVGKCERQTDKHIDSQIDKWTKKKGMDPSSWKKGTKKG